MNILNSKNLDKGNVPKDILTLRKIFDSLGIEEYEKNTLNFMSEFLNTYITDLPPGKSFLRSAGFPSDLRDL